MAERKEREPIPQKKFALIARVKGEDRYVLADEEGHLINGDEELVIQHRKNETLVSFRTLVEALGINAKEIKESGLIPSNMSAEDYVQQNIKDIITRSVALLGFPPKKRINFYSVPEEVVAKFDWIFRRPLRW